MSSEETPQAPPPHQIQYLQMNHIYRPIHSKTYPDWISAITEGRSLIIKTHSHPHTHFTQLTQLPDKVILLPKINHDLILHLPQLPRTWERSSRPMLCLLILYTPQLPLPLDNFTPPPLTILLLPYLPQIDLFPSPRPRVWPSKKQPPQGNSLK